MTRIYASIIDSFLDDIAPSQDQELRRGQDIRDLAGKYVDNKLLDEISGDSHHTVVPGGGGVTATADDWADRSTASFVKEDSLLRSAFNEDGANKISDEKICASIKAALNGGSTPLRVAAMLDKLAEQTVFNRTHADDFLKSQSGLLGLVYIEPNHFMGSCDKTFNRLKASGKPIRALSVKACSSCAGCSKCKVASDESKRCALYGKPIVENAADVEKMLREKKVSAKKATLTAMHNGLRPQNQVQVERSHEAATIRTAGDKPIQETKTFTAKDIETQLAKGGNIEQICSEAKKRFGSVVTANALKAYQASQKAPKAAAMPKAVVREAAPVTIRTAGDKHIPETKTFTAKDVQAQLAQGADLQRIYHGARQTFGSAVTASAVKSYLASLKGSNTKIALAQIDCTILKKRLASSETIIGDSKCAGCTLRNGMHCGRTGGTLLSFPGMDKAATSTKIASSGPEVDGATMLADYDLVRHAAVSIKEQTLDRLDVEMPATFRMDVE